MTVRVPMDINGVTGVSGKASKWQWSGLKVEGLGETSRKWMAAIRILVTAQRMLMSQANVGIDLVCEGAAFSYLGGGPAGVKCPK